MTWFLLLALFRRLAYNIAAAQPFTVSQVTSNCSATDPPINAEGTRIAFMSQCNVTGGNPDKSSEVLLFNSTTGSFKHISNSSVGSAASGGLSARARRPGPVLRRPTRQAHSDVPAVRLGALRERLIP